MRKPVVTTKKAFTKVQVNTAKIGRRISSLVAIEEKFLIPTFAFHPG